MRYEYIDEATRCFRWHGRGDVRAWRAPDGWKATAALVDEHPVTHRALTESEWWVIEHIEQREEDTR